MSSQVATILCIAVIAGLFILDRHPKGRTSLLLWLPVIWLAIMGSREVTAWMALFGYGEGGGSELEGQPFDRHLYLCMLAVGVAALIYRGKPAIRVLRANLPILVYFFYCALSVMWSEYPDVSFKRWIKSLCDIVMVLLVVTDSNRILAIKRLMSRTSFVLVPLSILFIKWYPFIGMGYKRFDGAAIVTGVAINKNTLGFICMIFGLAAEWRCFSLFREPRSRARTRHLLANGLLLAMVVWILLRANSMTGLSCFVLAGSLLAATSVRSVVKTSWLPHALFASIVFGAVSTLFLDIGTSSLEAIGRDPTLTGRTVIWNLVIRLTGNPLLGAGFESFWLPGWRRDIIWQKYWWQPNEAHNGYIEVFLNLGLIGIILLGIIIVTGYGKVFSALRRNSESCTLCLAYFTVGVIYSFTEAGFRMLHPVWISFLLGIIASSQVASESLAYVSSRYKGWAQRPELRTDASEASESIRLTRRTRVISRRRLSLEDEAGQ